MRQVFLLVRHARNALLRVPDDVRDLGQPLLPPLAAGAVLTPPPGAQLLPCVLLLPGRPDTECRRRRLAPTATPSKLHLCHMLLTHYAPGHHATHARLIYGRPVTHTSRTTQ